MFSFTATLLKYSNKGEKTGWTYLDVPADIILKFKRKDKKEFRVKGLIDDLKFDRLAVYPIGDGNFIIAVNAQMRKALGKKEGAMVSLKIEIDESPPIRSQELLVCLAEDPIANEQFESLLLSQRNYFHHYIADAKGQETKAKRILNTIQAMYLKQDFGAMIRSLKKN
jgi:hypothetical protein